MMPLHTSMYPTQVLDSNSQELCSTPSVNLGYEPIIDPVLKSNQILLVCSILFQD